MATTSGLAILLVGLCPALASAQSTDSPPAEPAPEGQHGADALPTPLAEEAAQALSRFVVPEGFRVELFAAEPLMAHPVAFTFDTWGRAYIAETYRQYKGVTDMRGHMDWLEDDIASKSVSDRVAMYIKHLGEDAVVEGYGVESERVNRVADTDGDGVADSSTVFAEGFDELSAGIGAGLLVRPLNGERATEVWYTCIPDVWRLTDRDGDGQAEERTNHSTGYGLRVALLGHDLHGPIVGPDGRIYFTCGDRGFNVMTSEGLHLVRYGTGAVFSCELDGRDLQLFCDGLRNPQEIVFDDFGNLFTLDNNSDSGDMARWTYLLRGSDSGWRQAYQWANDRTPRGPWNSEGMWKPFFGEQPAFILPPIANFTSGPSGMTLYPGTGLGEEWRGKFFVCDFRGNPGYSGIYAFDQRPMGAGFAIGEPERFVWDALPTDVEFGVDGNLYWSDWVTGWNMTGKGRLYRAVPEDRDEAEVAAVAGTRRALEALAWEGAGGNGTEAGLTASRSAASGLSDVELVNFFGHRDRRVRQEAQLAAAHRALAAEDLGTGLERLALVLERAQTPASDGPHRDRERVARLHAIWALGHVGRLSPKLGEELLRPLSELFNDPDPEIVAQIARVFGALRWGPPEGALVALLKNGEPRVKLLAAEALGGLQPAQSSTAALVELLMQSATEDPWLRHAAVHALERLGDKEAVYGHLEHPESHVRQAMAVVLRRWSDPTVARLLKDPNPLVRAEAARAIYDAPIADAMGDLAAFLGTAPEGAKDLLTWRRAVHAAREVATAESAALLSDFAASYRGPAIARAEALEVLANWPTPLTRDGILRDHRPLPGGDESHLKALNEHPIFSATFAASVARSKTGAVEDDDGALADALVTLHRRYWSEEAEAALAILASAEALPASPRRAALQSLLELAPDSDQTKSLLASALDVVGSPLRALAFSTLMDDEAARLLLQAAVEGPLSDREEAVRILGALGGETSGEAFALLGLELAEVRDGAMAPTMVEWLEGAAEHEHPAVKLNEASLLAAWDAAQGPEPSGEVAASDPLVGWRMCFEGGDAAAGAKIFAAKAETSCTKCHMVGAEGGSEAGPALDGVADRLNDHSLLSSIVEPNADIAEGFQSWILVADGETFAGRIIEETDELILLENAKKEVLEFTPDELEVRKRDVSAMPGDISTYLSRREMRDLMAYLQSLSDPGDVPR